MHLLLSLLFVTQAYAADVAKKDAYPLQPAFFSLFEHLEHPITTINEANEFAQAHLLRRGERWDVQQETDLHRVMKKNEGLLREDLKALGILSIPHIYSSERRYRTLKENIFGITSKDYNYALLMGTLKDDLILRMDYLSTLTHHCTFGTIALLGSERDLLPEEKEGLPEHITTEAQMMEYLYNEHLVLKDLKKIVINTPKIQNPDGTCTRPTTDNTLKQFGEVAKHNCSADKKPWAFVISNGRYTFRQILVASRILSPLGFLIDGDGPDETDTSNIVMDMDEFARIVYEIHKSLTGSK